MIPLLYQPARRRGRPVRGAACAVTVPGPTPAECLRLARPSHRPDAVMADPRPAGRRGRDRVRAAVTAGSVALLGFGLDSGIEAPASIIVIWRFTWTRLGARPRTGPAKPGQAGKPPSPPAPSRTTFSARAPNPGSDSQGTSGLRKITRSLSPDRATCGWTGHRRRRPGLASRA
jgi:hypothetical protein